MFGSLFLKLFMRIVLENTKNIILVLFEYTRCSSNLFIYLLYSLYIS